MGSNPIRATAANVRAGPAHPANLFESGWEPRVALVTLRSVLDRTRRKQLDESQITRLVAKSLIAWQVSSGTLGPM